MKTMWTIYRADLSRARSSLITIVVIFGLVVIPSLFTWFNVAASWNPFSNTRSLRIAIANTDEGYKSDLVPLHINIGDQVVAALRTNENFDWVIASEEGAIEGTRSGEYYAAIVIPAEFSQDMLTFFDGDATSAPMTYYVNEKKNGISPKLAGQGRSPSAPRLIRFLLRLWPRSRWTRRLPWVRHCPHRAPSGPSPTSIPAYRPSPRVCVRPPTVLTHTRRW